jgi:hypothetical protein
MLDWRRFLNGTRLYYYHCWNLLGHLHSSKFDANEEICFVTINIDVSIEYFKNIIINKFSITHTSSIIQLDEWVIITDIEWSEVDKLKLRLSIHICKNIRSFQVEYCTFGYTTWLSIFMLIVFMNWLEKTVCWLLIADCWLLVIRFMSEDMKSVTRINASIDCRWLSLIVVNYR